MTTIRAVFGSVASVSVALCVGFAGAPVVSAMAPDAPPDTEPPGGDTSFERQLAEWSFGTFLAIDVGVDPGTFTCTEPSTMEVGESVTCFAIVADERVIVATTTASGASGIFEFSVIGDYLVADEPAPTVPNEVTTTPVSPSTQPLTPTTFSRADTTEANVAVLLQGDSINQIAPNEIAAMLNASDGSVIAVNAWRWNGASGTFTVDFTLNPASDIDPDVAAWIAATNLSMHWGRGQAFREPAATIRPILLIVVSGRRYESSWDLTAQVADQTVGREDWLAAARQT